MKIDPDPDSQISATQQRKNDDNEHDDHEHRSNKQVKQTEEQRMLKDGGISWSAEIRAAGGLKLLMGEAAGRAVKLISLVPEGGTLTLTLTHPHPSQPISPLDLQHCWSVRGSSKSQFRCVMM